MRCLAFILSLRTDMRVTDRTLTKTAIGISQLISPFPVLPFFVIVARWTVRTNHYWLWELWLLLS